MDHRPPARRSVTRVLSAAALLVLLTGCVENRERYPHVGQGGGWTQGSVVRTVLLYLVLPVVLAIVISAPTLIAAARKRHRYRPNEGWNAEPVWFAGPADPVTAVQQAQTGDVVRGGAGGSW